PNRAKWWNKIISTIWLRWNESYKRFNKHRNSKWTRCGHRSTKLNEDEPRFRQITDFAIAGYTLLTDLREVEKEVTQDPNTSTSTEPLTTKIKVNEEAPALRYVARSNGHVYQEFT